MNRSPETIIGRYRILSYLGSGRMGKVYLAEDTALKCTVTLKLLPADIANDAQQVKRLINEAKVVSSINHPNIVTIYDVGEIKREEDPSYFIVTEFVPGDTLRQHMQRGRKVIKEVLDIGIQTASALSAAHEAGIIHRDIKPENILLREDGLIKVLDFGITKAVEHLGRDKVAERMWATNEPTFVGAPSYMSPEQVRGLELDPRTDIWSFGTVLYEMVSGHAPFKEARDADTLAAILEKEPPPLMTTTQDCPDEFQRIINKSLRKNIEERYQTVRDMAADLKLLRQKLEKPELSSSSIVLYRGVNDQNEMAERELIESESASLYINLWIEDEHQMALSALERLTKDVNYKFMLAIETWSREEANTTEPFHEPEELKQAPATKVTIEVLCPFLEATENGYIRREVDYYAGRGFDPEVFDLKPAEEGRFNLTARLIVKGETIYREVIGLEVVSPSAEDLPEKAASTVIP